MRHVDQEVKCSEVTKRVHLYFPDPYLGEISVCISPPPSHTVTPVFKANVIRPEAIQPNQTDKAQLFVSWKHFLFKISTFC